MGVWGAGILENDESLDAYTLFKAKIEEGRGASDAKKDLHQLYSESGQPGIIDNTDYWLGLAMAQHELGIVDQEVISIIHRIVNEKIDLEDWRERAEDDEELIEERIGALADFLKELETK